jgi:transcriptional regulator with GAF, ATPase, and Fis domain
VGCYHLGVATLLALFGSKQGLRLPLESSCLVGRASSADVQLIDARASREHCRFTVEDGQVSVEDLGSQNGTFVNGEPIAGRVRLGAGDEIAVGDSLFVLDGDWDVLAARYGEGIVCLGPSTTEGALIRARPGDGREDAGREQVVRVEALARRLAEVADRQEAAQLVLAALDEAFTPDRAFVLSAEGTGVRPLCGKSQGAAVSISRTVLELVRRDGQGVLLDDAVADPEMQKARSVLRHGLRSVMVAPIGAGASPRGFLHVDRAGPGLYAAQDLTLLAAMAAVVGLSEVAQPRRAPTAQRPSDPTAADGGARLVGAHASFREALRIMEAAARVDSSVLITGESGTGKEELARALHTRSGRARGPFVAVNCSAIPESLAESALFGHQKGAFTGAVSGHEGYFEAADGGTLLLDEVGELAPAVQAKLLRALQERLFFRLGSTTPRRSDVRVVAATHRDLEREVAAGRFREDLYFRLNVLRIRMPPLRDRPEDIGPLARALLERVAARLGRPAPPLAASAEKALSRWRWPGNARELGNVLERLLVLREPGDHEPIDGDEVNAALGRDPTSPPPPPAVPEGDTLADKIASLERREIEAALRRARGVKSQAARALGLSRPSLDKKFADDAIDLWAPAPPDET